MWGTTRMAELVMLTRGGVRTTPSTLTPVRPAMLGLTRGATVGLMVDTRDSMWRLGVRMMLCACTADPTRQENGSKTAVTVTAVLMRRFMESRAIGPLGFLRGYFSRRYGVSTARLTIFSFCSLPTSA